GKVKQKLSSGGKYVSVNIGPVQIVSSKQVPSQLVALSNMPVVEEKLNGNLKIVSYQESPIMSTYLVAAIVGLFDYVEDHTPDVVKDRVYCQAGKANQRKVALDVAVKTLGLYKEHAPRNI
nr:aminopeptidase M1 [Tanacetum cinerariifolium]